MNTFIFYIGHPKAYTKHKEINFQKINLINFFGNK